MQRNIRSLSSIFVGIVVFSLNFFASESVIAGAPRLGECIVNIDDRMRAEFNINRESKVITPRMQENLQSFADVTARRTNDGLEFEIQVNPTLYYLGRETQQWLFFRQCGRINLMHESILSREVRISIQEDQAADCWAIEYMLQESLISPREVQRIQRDIEMLEGDSRRWRAVFEDRRSRVTLADCPRL